MEESVLMLGETHAEAELAGALGVSKDTVVEVFGTGWRRAPSPDDYDQGPDGLTAISDAYGPWFLSGVPPQVMVRVTHEAVEVAMPHGQWQGDRGLTWTPSVVRYLPVAGWEPDAVRTIIDEFVQARRSTFVFCRACRTLTGPEERQGTDLCVPCMAQMLAMSTG